jgi:hypothetical protein
MDYSHAAIEHAIEHFEGIANKRDDMETRTLADLWRPERILRNAVDYSADSRGFQQQFYEGRRLLASKTQFSSGAKRAKRRFDFVV